MSSSRQSRLYLSARIVSLIRENNKNGLFSAQELLHIESLLRDEFVSNQWLFNVCNAIIDQSILVTHEECDLYEKFQTEEQLTTVSKTEVKELQNKLEFLKEKALILRYLCNDLNKKLKQFSKNDSKTDEKEQNIRQTFGLNLNFKLQESLALLKSDMSSHFTFNDPKDIVEQMVNQLNVKAIQNNDNKSPIDWLSEQLDELALSHINKHQLFDALSSQFSVRLKHLKQSLLKLNEECLRIKDFYDINIREEMVWRQDLNIILNKIREIGETREISLPQMSSDLNELNAKKQLIPDLNIFQRIESQEFDEFESLINSLKERIEILQTNKS